MTQISMDPEAMRAHVRMHGELSDILEQKLNGIPTAVDGGLASDTVAALMMRVGNAVDALYRINGTLGEIVGAIAEDAQATEQEAIDMFTPVTREVEELGS